VVCTAYFGVGAEGRWGRLGDLVGWCLGVVEGCCETLFRARGGAHERFSETSKEVGGGARRKVQRDPPEEPGEPVEGSRETLFQVV
jgi:hypothetical protein